jgi:hypothetical protein
MNIHTLVLSIAFVILSSLGCATTQASTSSLPVARRDHAAQETQTDTLAQLVREFRPYCVDEPRMLGPGEHLTAITLDHMTAPVYHVGVSRERGVAPQTEIDCYHMTSGRHAVTIYLISQWVPRAIQIEAMYLSSNSGSLNVDPAQVVLPQLVELDGARLATNPWCHERLGFTACEHHFPSQNDD